MAPRRDALLAILATIAIALAGAAQASALARSHRALAAKASPCIAQLESVFAETQAREAALEAVKQRDVARTELCSAWSDLADADAHLAEFVATHAGACRIPPALVSRKQAAHARLVETRGRMCAAPEARPRRGTNPKGDFPPGQNLATPIVFLPQP
jgi:hypothetical protein